MGCITFAVLHRWPRAVLAFSHGLSERTAKLSLQSHMLLLEMSCLFFEYTACTPVSPWCLSLTLSRLTNHFTCLLLRNRSSSSLLCQVSKEFTRSLDPSKRKRCFWGYFLSFFPVENLSLTVWIESYPGSYCLGFWCPQKSLGHVISASPPQGGFITPVAALS